MRYGRKRLHALGVPLKRRFVIRDREFESPLLRAILEDRQIPDLALEQEIFGPEVHLIRAAKPSFAELVLERFPLDIVS
jgi:hypothetical protein